MLDLITIGIFLAVAAVVFVTVEILRRTLQSPARRRLRELSESETGEYLPRDDTNVFRDSLASQVPQQARARGDIQSELLQAGYYRPSAISYYLAIRNGLMVAALVGTGALAVLIGPDHEALVWRVLLIGLGLTIVCWALPRLILKIKARRRVERLTRSLPFALDMVTMCLSGGAPLPDALKHVTSEISTTHPDLADELAIVHQQSELSTLELALRQFASRVGTPEVVALAALVNQNQALGTETSRAVQDYAENLRLQWRQSADERANRVGVFALLPLVFCLLPAVFILLWGPAAMEMWDFLSDIKGYIPEPPDIGATPIDLGDRSVE